VRLRYSNVSQLLKQKTSDTPVFCLLPRHIRAAVERFCAGFPGEVMYAVKANPDRQVLGWLVEAGIRAFDTASLTEIELAREARADAHCAYNHPVKPRAALAQAYRRWGIRDYVVDHRGELEKVFQELGHELTVQVRVAMPNNKARVSFNEKFGASPQEAVGLLRAVRQRGAAAALTMHIGWQSTDPQSFAAGVRLLAGIAAEANVQPEYLNVGGGFPTLLMPAELHIEDFFAAIRVARESEPGIRHIPLRCEPGSALVTEGGAVLAQVLLVKEEALYLNDGIYGAMAELLHSRMQPPTRVFSRAGEPRHGALRRFRVFGPTCDSFDVSPAPFEVPADICEGDWLCLASMGAYSMPLITDFNGLGAHEFAILDELG
jgi:ornithine decarboxylase